MTVRTATLLTLAALLVGCGRPELETRTFEVRYLSSGDVHRLIEPYVFSEREGQPGSMSTMEGALTVRETGDNLDKIARVLERFDRPRPTVMLHFQIIEADGAAESDPSIAEVERELRRLFRFDGYELVEEAQVVAIQGTGIRQVVGDPSSQQGFIIQGGVSEVRRGADTPTVTVDVGLFAAGIGDILETSVTIPVDHSVVLGTAKAPSHEGALILVVRAEILPGAAGAAPPADST